MKAFPSDFLWGASSSAFQIEGAYLEDGKSLTIMDMETRSGIADTKIAIDHYHHWKEDIALMKECGLTSYRFSISWSRILPQGRGTVNSKGIQFYNNLINELCHNGIKPIVTLYHFDLPLCLQEEYHGWSSREILKDFEEFCSICFENFGDRVAYWLTINEHNNCLYMPKFVGGVEDGVDINHWRFKVNHHLALAHAIAVRTCRNILPHAIIGPALGWEAAYPATCRPEDVLASMNRDLFTGKMILDLNVKGRYPALVWSFLEKKGWLPTIEEGDFELLAQGKPDFIALNYYSSVTVKEAVDGSSQVEMQYNLNGKKGTRIYPNYPGLYQESNNPYLEATAWDWPIDPLGFRITLRTIYDRYELPLMITENGLGSLDVLEDDGLVHDNKRIEYLERHIEQMQYALEEGVKILSYNPWSFFDVLSSSNGFAKRYGLVYIDRTETDLRKLKRYKKDSFFWYKRLIQNNGL